MTPEQKAHYEYGEARGVLKERKSLMRFTESLGECSDYHGEPRLMYGVEAAIRDAWQKRAACRVWVPLEYRECQSCRYYEEPDGSEICDSCIVFNRLADACNWDPRKEGE